MDGLIRSGVDAGPSIQCAKQASIGMEERLAWRLKVIVDFECRLSLIGVFIVPIYPERNSVAGIAGPLRWRTAKGPEML